MIAAFGLAGPALAGTADGKIQLKAMGAILLPDGKMKRVVSASPEVAAALPAGADSKANHNFVPIVSAEYFFNPDLSIETICCFTKRDIHGAGSLKGARGLVSNAAIIPATFTLKYHIRTDAGIKPYIGAGPSYYLIFSEKTGATATALGASKVRLSNAPGVALQAGVDIPLNDTGLSVSLDAKRYFLKNIKARWTNGAGNRILDTRHKLDPWVLSAGLAYRF